MKKTTKYNAGFDTTVWHKDEIAKPFLTPKTKKPVKPRTWFVNSMSDTFIKDVPDDFIQALFKHMNAHSLHTFQVLTKRAERMHAMIKNQKIHVTDNIWLGVSVESKNYKGRIDLLKKTPARIKFVMFEPLKDSIGDYDLKGIQWAIVGGENHPKCYPMNPDWAREIRDMCIRDNVLFTFKQYSGKSSKAIEKLGRCLDGILWDERPLYQTELAANMTTHIMKSACVGGQLKHSTPKFNFNFHNLFESVD